jgi:hypothetical protein
MDRESLRGGARDAAGPLIMTYRIHQWIREHPASTMNDIVTAAFNGNFVDVGYARRAFARSLNYYRRRRRERAVETPASVIDRTAEAIQFVVRQRVRAMAKPGGSLLLCEGRFTVRRGLMIRSGLTEDQMASRPQDTERHVKHMALLRALRPETHQLKSPRGRLSKAARAAILAYLEIVDSNGESCA